MSRSLRYSLIVFPLCLSLTITGCGLQDLLGNKKKTSSPTKGNQTTMAVSLDESDPNKLLITKGIEDMAKKENVKVQYMAQSAGGSDASLKDAKILIYQGGDPSVLQTSQTEKIPVLALSQLPPRIKPEGIITPDQEKAGELMAQTLVSKVTEGEVVILQGDPNSSEFQECLAGSKAILSKYPKITVQTIASSPGTELITKANLAELLQKNPGKVQGILAQTEKLAVQASDVLKQAQLEKKILLVGGQASVSSLERMASGVQVGDIDTAPYLQGVNAYQWAQKIIKKETLDVNDSVTSDQGEIPAKVIPVKAVTSDNLAVIQKSYIKTMQSAEQDQKQNAKKGTEAPKGTSQGAEQGKAAGATQGASQGTAQGQSADKTGASSAQPSTSTTIPPGVKKVTERIKTETTREYLDEQGKVIGTENTANEQVKTVPPEMLKQQTEQPKAPSPSSKDQGDQASKSK